MPGHDLPGRIGELRPQLRMKKVVQRRIRIVLDGMPRLKTLGLTTRGLHNPDATATYTAMKFDIQLDALEREPQFALASPQGA